MAVTRAVGDCIVQETTDNVTRGVGDSILRESSSGAAPAADVLNQGLAGIEHGVVASGGGGHSGLHPINSGYVS